MKLYSFPSRCTSSAVALSCAWALVSAGAFTSLPAQAGQFSVSPLRIFMTPRDRATAITLVNEGDSEVLIQADLYQWQQKADGSEDLSLTEDLILSPPIIRLAPRARQVVRLALLRPMPRDMQSTYRMLVREIPEAQPKEQGLTLQIAMAFSLPVFISPPGVKRQLQCTAERVQDHRVRAHCENIGNAYAQPVEFSLTAPGGERLAGSESGGYVLPGMKRSFELAVPATQKVPVGPARLMVRQDNGATETFDLTLGE